MYVWEGGGGRVIVKRVAKCVYWGRRIERSKKSCEGKKIVAYLVRVGGWDEGIAETLALVAHQQMNVVLCICFLITGKRRGRGGIC